MFTAFLTACASDGVSSETKARFEEQDRLLQLQLKACKATGDLNSCRDACLSTAMGASPDALAEACDASCEGGDAGSCAHVAGQLWRESNKPLATRYYEKACVLGNLGSCGNIHRMMADGYVLQSGDLSKESIVEKLTLSCNEDALVGCYWLGQGALREWSISRSSAAARSAADFNLKACYAKGNARDQIWACMISQCLQGKPGDLRLTSHEACERVELPASASMAGAPAP